MAPPFPFPELCVHPADYLSVDDASLRIKYEGMLSTESVNTTCPVQSVTLHSMELHNTHLRQEYNDTSQHTRPQDWEVLVSDSPREKKFQSWKGSLVRMAGAASDDFIPLTEGGQDIRTERDGARTVPILTHGAFLLSMRDIITRCYEIEEVRDTGISMVSQVPEGSSAYEIERYTLNCSALIPENSSTNTGERAPVIILNSDFDLSATNPVAGYRGPVRWITPNTSASTTRRYRSVQTLPEFEF